MFKMVYRSEVEGVRRNGKTSESMVDGELEWWVGVEMTEERTRWSSF